MQRPTWEACGCRRRPDGLGPGRRDRGRPGRGLDPGRPGAAAGRDLAGRAFPDHLGEPLALITPEEALRVRLAGATLTSIPVVIFFLLYKLWDANISWVVMALARSDRGADGACASMGGAASGPAAAQR